MQISQRLTSRRISSAIVIVALVVLTGCTQVSGAPEDGDRVAQAWTDRLNGQARAAVQRAQEEARQQRANDAYSLRLTEQARAQAEQQSRERANQAWTDRLNGLAERLGADR